MAADPRFPPDPEPEPEPGEVPEVVPVRKVRKPVEGAAEAMQEFFGTLSEQMQVPPRYTLRAIPKESVMKAGDAGMPMPPGTRSVYAVGADDHMLYVCMVQDDPEARARMLRDLQAKMVGV